MTDRDYGLIVNDPGSWERVRREAAAEVSAALEAAAGVGPEFGSPIAWSLTRDYGGVTTGLSLLHRVGVTIGKDLFTTCGEVIPNHPARWVPLSPALLRTLPRCKHCDEAAQSHHLTGIAA